LDRKEKAEITNVTLRGIKPGDLGWIAHRQMRIYAEEYGWDWTFEGLVCEVLGKFVRDFDPLREDAWVAERDGAILGSIFLMKSDDAKIAKLRLLYVEAEARGLGLGKRLVQTCIARARALGYAELTLWTNDILHAARKTYFAEGFLLVAAERRHAFGCDLVAETWTLSLGPR
jgi:GNAT superfamily N-acetyltransferase